MQQLLDQFMARRHGVGQRHWVLDRGNGGIATDHVKSLAETCRAMDFSWGEGVNKYLNELRHSLQQAVTELQFHDMAAQLIAHIG